jgi:phosphoglycolate phosphatase-like HAD superfamily hydrolase
MNLAIFDVDGTLTSTNEVDEICLVQAFADAHAITGLDTNWNAYRHATDSGITLQIFQDRFGRDAKPNELRDLQRCFVRLLKEQLAASPSLFAAVPGSTKMLARLKQEPEWTVAVATGCWQVSAQLKLEAASLTLNGFPLASAEMGFSREEILQAAIERASRHYQQTSFDRVVSIGDAPWDVRAARNLELNFVGVGSGERAMLLTNAGASHVIEDYQDYDLFLRHLESAGVPMQKVLVKEI